VKSILITNVPSPYRAKQYNLIGDILGKNFSIFYTHSNYPTTEMKWKRPYLTHNYLFLDSCKHNLIPKFISLFIRLNRNKPDIIITSGFNIYMLTGFIFAKLLRRKHIVFTDSWLHAIKQLSYLHHIIRKLVIKRSDGFICVGIKGKEYLKHFGADPKRIFISRLSDKIHSFNNQEIKKEYDLIFSGQLIERKMPLFFVEVVNEVSHAIKGLKVLILGAGPLEEKMIKKLDEYEINYCYKGFISPEMIKDQYLKARILLFPTLNDPWGMVANDAMSIALPVVTTPYAGAAGDLIIDGYNGFIIEPDVKKWAEKITILLNNTKLYSELSKNAHLSIKDFSVEKAATDFATALKTVSEI
jgi:glycosyltransferase involved in cell wall biosynthesis